MSIRILVLASAGALVGAAQIQEMSANADGSAVVFVEASTGALYRLDFEASPRRAVATRIAPPPAFARYSRPQFLADGSIAYTNISCFRFCTFSQTYRLKDGAVEFVGNGTGFASANGRYLYLRNLDYFLSPGTVFGSRLIDTQTNRTLCEALPGSPKPECMGRGFVSGPTNLGQALLVRTGHPIFGGGYEIVRRAADGSQTPAIRETEPPTAAVISANGEAAAYLANTNSGFDLVNGSLDRSLRQPSGLPPAANFIVPPVVIASDGSFTLFARSILPTTAPPAITTALYLLRRGAATEQRLTIEPGQFSSLALSGDDRYAIYTTSEGAIRRIALATGTVEDWGRQHLINRAGTDNAASAGSLAQILGFGFSNAAVTVNGLTARILAQDANRILYFVPPETSLGNLTVEVRHPPAERVA